MKRISMKLGVMILVASAVARAQVAPPATAPAAVLSVSLIISPQQEFLVNFKNTSERPLVINLGEMLANGRQLLPSSVQIVSTDPMNIQRVFTVARPPGVAGRVDDWLIALRPGDHYVLTLKPQDLVQEKTFERYQPQAGLRLAVRFEGKPPSNDNNGSLIPGLPVIKGLIVSPSIPSPPLDR